MTRRASCPACGWVGPERNTWATADRDQFEHDKACTAVAVPLFGETSEPAP